jgi:hypothetical protein
MHRALHLGSRKPLAWWCLTTGSISRPSPRYVIPIGIDDEVEMNCVDTLAAPAANILADDFMEFLFLDAPPAGSPEA